MPPANHWKIALPSPSHGSKVFLLFRHTQGRWNFRSMKLDLVYKPTPLDSLLKLNFEDENQRHFPTRTWQISNCNQFWYIFDSWSLYLTPELYLHSQKSQIYSSTLTLSHHHRHPHARPQKLSLRFPILFKTGKRVDFWFLICFPITHPILANSSVRSLDDNPKSKLVRTVRIVSFSNHSKWEFWKCLTVYFQS